MAKRPQPKRPKLDADTFLLARQSRLFRPGAEFMLAVKRPKNTGAKRPAGRKTR